MPKPPREVVVRGSAADAARRGHPWVFRHAVLPQGAGAPRRGGPPDATLAGVAAGDEVQVVGEDGAPVGRAVADPDSPIALRMWTSGRAPVDESLVAERIASALAVRERLFASGATTAYRLLNGEGDRCPGFVVDRYDTVAVLRVDGGAALARLDRFVDVLWPRLAARAVRSLVHRPTGEKPGSAVKTPPALLRGDAPPATIEVREHGVPFVVDLAQGQKTGAFLDQRENRRRVGELAQGRRVLNLFSYAGGFSVRAALGGAVRVTSVDIAAKAHATAQSSFRLAGADPRAHHFVTADAFAFLAEAKKKNERFDLVVSDPPSFAPSEKAVPRALAAYRTLHRACAEVLAPGGILCAASCSSHVDAEAFVATLDDGALGVRTLRLLEVHGAPADHPSLPAWPEGRYLKFCVLS